APEVHDVRHADVALRRHQRGTVLQRVQIGPADAAGDGPYQHLADLGLGVGNGVDDERRVAHHDGAHAGRYSAQPEAQTSPSSNDNIVCNSLVRASVIFVLALAAHIG